MLAFNNLRGGIILRLWDPETKWPNFMTYKFLEAHFPKVAVLKCPTTPMAPAVACSWVHRYSRPSTPIVLETIPEALAFAGRKHPWGAGLRLGERMGWKVATCMLEMLDMLEFFRSIIIKSKQILEVTMQNPFVGIHEESNLSNQRFLLKKSSLKFNVIK